MLLVLGFSQHDRHQAVALAHHIESLGKVENHDALLVCPEGLSFDDIEEPFRRAFRSVQTQTYKPTLHGWPQGPNELFAVGIVPAVLRHPVDAPWMLLEPDCVPTRPTWLNEIETAYRRCGKYLLGKVVDTVFIDTGEVTGRHTVGVAVYPKLFPRLCKIVKYVVGMSADHVRRNQIPKAFDAYFGPYTAPNTADTDLIQHLWRSRAFTKDQDGIIRDDKGRKVSEEAAIVHGCKDDSLINFFRVAPRKSEPVKEVQTSKPVPTAPPVYGEPPAKETPQPVISTEPLQDPPFAKNSPEWLREMDLVTMKWNKLRGIAIDYDINTHKMKRKDVEIAIVLYEREHENVEWAQRFHRERDLKAKEAQKPVEQESRPIADWRSEPPQDSGISPQMQAKMLALRRERELRVTA